MLAKVLLTLAVVVGMWFLIKKAGSAGKAVRGKKQDIPTPPDVVDLEPCPKCGGYHEGGAGNCPSS